MNELFTEHPQILDKEVKKLMKNIHDGISKYTIVKLNKILSGMIRKPKKTEDLDFVFKIVCSQYDITKEELINSQSRGEGTTPKMITWVLLNRVIGVSVKEVATQFKRYPNSITHGLSQFDYIIGGTTKDSIALKESYKKCEAKLIKHLNIEEI